MKDCRPSVPPACGVGRRQSGISLIVSLVILLAVAMLGTAAARIAMQGEKAARNDRDRQVAFQAAEAALLDAERDIDASPDASLGAPSPRRKALTAMADHALPMGCAVGHDNPLLGLCAGWAQGDGSDFGSEIAPAWFAIDLSNADPATTRSAPYGRFTGQQFPVEEGALPARLPRYVIEPIGYNAPGASADTVGRVVFYRVTAIGFGARDHSQVVLQSFYRETR
jgi:type IV pilus assembly protein PilX